MVHGLFPHFLTVEESLFFSFPFHLNGFNSSKYINMGCLRQMQKVYEVYEKKPIEVQSI